MLLPKRISGWKLFSKRGEREASEAETNYENVGGANSYPMHRYSIVSTSSTSVIAPVYNKLALDVALLNIRHVRVDHNGRFLETIDSGLNRCLTLEANKDQSGLAFMQDAIFSMFDEGVVALVPTDTDVSIYDRNIVRINTLRSGRIMEWFPDFVRVDLYNDELGRNEQIVLPKSAIAIIENPLYAIMNEPNSTLKRLLAKLQLLDVIDEQSGSGKLDLLVQLPYAIKSDSRKKLADDRMTMLTEQLQDSKYGVGYIDATEKVIQLNRPAVNNLMEQVEYLTRMLYSQLGLSESLFSGTAKEEEYLNYYNRTIGPIAKALTLELKRKFLSKTAITQGQSISYFRDPFQFVTAEALAELSDKLTRNEIASSNDIRGVIGWEPSSDPKADELRNKNLNQSNSLEGEISNQNESKLLENARD